MQRFILYLAIALSFFVLMKDAYATTCAKSKQLRDLKSRCNVDGKTQMKLGDDFISGTEDCTWRPMGRDRGEWTCKPACIFTCQITVVKAVPHEMLPCGHPDPSPQFVDGCQEIVGKTLELKQMVHEMSEWTESGNEDSENPRRDDEEIMKKCLRMKDDLALECQSENQSVEMLTAGHCCVDPMFDINGL